MSRLPRPARAARSNIRMNHENDLNGFTTEFGVKPVFFHDGPYTAAVVEVESENGPMLCVGLSKRSESEKTFYGPIGELHALRRLHRYMRNLSPARASEPRVTEIREQIEELFNTADDYGNRIPHIFVA